MKTFYAIFLVENIQVVRAIEARTMTEAAHLALRLSRVAARLTGRDWSYQSIHASFPVDLSYDADTIGAEEAVAKKLWRGP